MTRFSWICGTIDLYRQARNYTNETEKLLTPTICGSSAYYTHSTRYKGRYVVVLRKELAFGKAIRKVGTPEMEPRPNREPIIDLLSRSELRSSDQIGRCMISLPKVRSTVVLTHHYIVVGKCRFDESNLPVTTFIKVSWYR